jgi:hypothetical protein
VENLHSWVQPLREPFVALRLVELLDLLLKHGENAANRMAAFEPVGERVCEKILLCAFFVRFQDIIEN